MRPLFILAAIFLLVSPFSNAASNNSNSTTTLNCQIEFQEIKNGQLSAFLVESAPPVTVVNDIASVAFEGKHAAVFGECKGPGVSVGYQLKHHFVQKEVLAPSSQTPGLGFISGVYEDPAGVFPGHKLAAVEASCVRARIRQ